MYKRLGLLAVLCGAIFLEGIDVSMMGVALPSMRAELGLSTTSLQWVVSAYVLGYGGFVLLGGRAADLLGRRRMFLLWLAVFLVFSGLGGLATSGWVLVLARFVTGVAAAFLAPAGLSIITTTFAAGRDRDRAVLLYAGAAAGGFSLGMVAGGLLTAIDWRWVFFAPVVVTAVLLVAAIRLVPRDTPPSPVPPSPSDAGPEPPAVEGESRSGVEGVSRSGVEGASRSGVGPASGGGGPAGRRPSWARRFDVAGTVMLTSGMSLLVIAVVRAPEVGLGLTLTTAAASAVMIALFAIAQRRAAAPLIRLGILRSAPLLRANAGALLLVGGFVGFQFILVLYLQELRGWSEVETGLALAVIGIDSILAPTVTPKLVERFGPARVIVGGFAFLAAAYAAFLPLGAEWTYLMMLPLFLAIGVGFALAYGPLTILATEGVDGREQGLAGGILTSSFQFGSAFGLAAVTAVVVATDGPPLAGFRAGLAVPLVAAALGGLVLASGRHRRPADVDPGDQELARI